MNKTVHGFVFAGILAAVTLAACGQAHVTHGSDLVAGHPLASVPGYDRAAALQVLQEDGVPVRGTPAQQLAFARTLLTKSGRDGALAKLAIPKASRAAAEAELLADVEHDHVLTKAGRRQLLLTDLPLLLEKYSRK